MRLRLPPIILDAPFGIETLDDHTEPADDEGEEGPESSDDEGSEDNSEDLDDNA